MANKRLEMLQIKQILQLDNDGKSFRQIANCLCSSRKTVTKYVLLFRSTGLKYQDIKDKSEHELAQILAEKEKPSLNRLEILSGKFDDLEKELRRKGMTKQLLWQEYKTENPDGYNYTQFCLYFNQWLRSKEVTMHLEHKAGDKMFIDYAGQKLHVTDRQTGQVREVEVFVAILGASQMTYVEASPSQKKEDFVASVANALEFYGGVPQAIVPDNLKSAVTTPNRYEADLNTTFQDFSLHYGTTVLPARSRKPRDKALVESAVKIIYTRIYAPLRKRVFFTIQDLNEAIWEELDKHNNMKFQGKEYSRSQLFAEVEAQALKPLPRSRYEIKNYINATVYKNCHVWLGCDKHYYSVPYRYVGKKVKIEYTRTNVAIYYNHERIAYHGRSYDHYAYTTIKEHMPSHHRLASEWCPDKFLGWASSVGPETELVIRKILDSKTHPEQAYKSCLGILSYGKKVGYERLNQACRRASEFGSYSYRTVKNILSRNYDSLFEDEQKQYISPLHSNIRGAEYYGYNH
jgi:transposase